MRVFFNIVLIGIGWCIGERMARKYKTHQKRLKENRFKFHWL
ncbi:MAG: hypothetical protein [Bacteriophage sp.]|nr:MAG: hypothetical protein [Bacteriophage sp.]